MKLPNKVNKYKTTIFYQMIEILEILDNNKLPIDIYIKVSNKMTINEFIEALSVLFMINKIKLLNDGRITKC